MVLIASEAASKLSPTAIFIRGVVVFIVAVVVFVGSVWLVLATDLGARKGVLVVSACLWGWMIILCLLWFRYPAQAPRPAGPVCLAGSVNPEFVEAGGASDQSQVMARRNVGGREEEVAIPACNSGILVTKWFYPGIFLIGSVVLMALTLLGLRKMERDEELAELLSESEPTPAG